ncbi:MAG: hypothetical protein QW088_07385 [Desulfurococcaceae archaeon]
MGYVKKIIDKLLALQDRFYPEVSEYYRIGEGRVSLLRVVGVDGDSVLLKVEGGRIKYARGDETPIHIFKTSVDTFLDIVSGDEDLRDAITKGHFIIENASTGTIDLVEMQKWCSAFSRLKGLVMKYLGGGK